MTMMYLRYMFIVFFLFTSRCCCSAVINQLDYPACHATSRLRGGTINAAGSSSSSSSSFDRVVVLGDVHGCLDGLRENLYHANITSRPTSCEWRDKEERTLLVQMGDVVDRGPMTLEAFECLEKLQREAPKSGSKVVRLVGNHCIWWLEGQTHMRNKRTDTNQKIKAVVEKMKASILKGDILGAYHMHTAEGISLFFSHAGLRPAMLHSLERRLSVEPPNSGNGNGSSSSNIVRIAAYINKQLHTDISRCSSDSNGKSEPGGGASSSSSSPCVFSDLLYSIGPERGGSDIGGCFWTDYAVLQKYYNGYPLLESTSTSTSTSITSSNSESTSPPSFIQIVGHSLEKGQIRNTQGITSVCVDAGMYIGGRAYLVINNSNSRFFAVEKSGHTGTWRTRDLTREVCNN